MNVSQAELWPLLAAPLAGALLAFGVGLKRRSLAGWIASAAAALSLLWTVVLVGALPRGKAFEQVLFDWISSGGMQAALVLRLDALSAVMCLVVCGVGTLIHLYAVAYMAGDGGEPRFFAYMNLFMCAMLILVLAGNLPVLFIGWEGVGLCSYLLIGFWYKRLSFAAAGMKAFILNRIGDAGFLAGIFLLYANFGTFDFAELKILIERHPQLTALYTAAALCLFIGAAGKSAQIPLFVWLPDAMAGPTPVSALIHAATMVTAGVYMMARLSFLFSLSGAAMLVIGIIALATALVAALAALAQNDIKKVLAYSTISQLGFMFMAAAVGAYWAAIFHLVAHSFFKACLFLCAGSVIHVCGHEQDLRRLGGLWRRMPLTALSFFLAALAMCGAAPLSGYYSKHAIFAALNAEGSAFSGGLGFLSAAAAVLTAVYIMRLFALVFLGSYRGDSYSRVHEAPWLMGGVVAALACLSVVGGYVLGEVQELQGYLKMVLPGSAAVHYGSLLEALKHSFVPIAAAAATLALYEFRPGFIAALHDKLPSLRHVFESAFGFMDLYRAFVAWPLEKASALLWRWGDQALIDGAVNGSGRLIDSSARVLRYSQSGQVRHYALCMFAAAVILSAFYMVF